MYTKYSNKSEIISMNESKEKDDKTGSFMNKIVKQKPLELLRLKSAKELLNYYFKK